MYYGAQHWEFTSSGLWLALAARLVFFSMKMWSGHAFVHALQHLLALALRCAVIRCVNSTFIAPHLFIALCKVEPRKEKECSQSLLR